MTLQKLQAEMIAAMKSGDKFRKNVISTTIAQIKNAAIDKGCRDNITESLVDEVLLKCKKTAQEQIDTCPADRIETLAAYVKQFDIIDEFAPKLITDEDDIKRLIGQYTDAANMQLIKSNRGAIMKIVAANLKGKVDMSVVNKVVGGMLR